MLVLPHTIGTLTLHRKLGTGSVAESFLATQADGRPVLARRLLPFIAKDPQRLAAISARVGELAGSRHPALVQVSGTVEEGGETCIIEEFVDGVSLDRLILAARNQGVQVPPNLFLHIAVQVCNALEALHSRSGPTGESVLHLGLKPGAVFVGVDGKVVVGSYGLTRSPSVLPQGGVASAAALRMEYLSPEQTHADQGLTPASDLFSLGALLYELLTLESLFRADSNLQTIHRIRRGEVTSQLLRVKSRMPGLDKVLYRALSVNPKHRYQRAFVLREDLRGLMSGYSFASVNDDARTWLAPLFEEGSRAVGLATAPPPAAAPPEPVAPPAPQSTGRTILHLVGLDDVEERTGSADVETTDIGFFPAGLPEPDPESSSARLAALVATPSAPFVAAPTLSPALPDPTASTAGGDPTRGPATAAVATSSAVPGAALGGGSGAPPPAALAPAPAPLADPGLVDAGPVGRAMPRPSMTLVALGDEDVPEPSFGSTLLPEQMTAAAALSAAASTASTVAAPDTTAAWIAPAGPRSGLQPVDPAAGPENTASFLPREEPDNTAGHIPPATPDPASAFGEERTLNAAGMVAQDPPAAFGEERTVNTASFLPPANPDPASAFGEERTLNNPTPDPAAAFGEERTLTQTGAGPRASLPPTAWPAPIPPGPPDPAASVPPPPREPAPLLAPKPAGRSMPPPRALPPPQAAPSATEPEYEDLETPAPSRFPVVLASVGVGLAAILLCSGLVWGVSDYAVQARAERVAAATKEAAPPEVQATDDPAATMADPSAGALPADALPIGAEPAVVDAAPAGGPPEAGSTGGVVGATAAPSVASPAAGTPVASTPAVAPAASTPAPVASTPVASRPTAVSAPPAPVASRPVVSAAPEPVATRPEPSRPVSTPVVTPVSRPVAPVATPVAVASDPTRSRVAVSTPVAPVATRPVEPLEPAADLGDDVLSVSSPALNLDSLATDARGGKLRPDDIAALGAVPVSDPSYTRAEALLLSNAQKRGDRKGAEAALTALFVLPENTYNPQFLAADALQLVNTGMYDRALTRAQLAEKYWSRLPPAQSFAMRAQIYEIEAAAWQGKFYNSGGDVASLESAIRAWEKYKEHVASESRTDLEKNADTQIAKLEDIRQRVQ